MGSGVGPWPGGKDSWPEGEHWDLELLENGDSRNVEDRFRYWKREAIKLALDETRFPYHVAIENLDHDFNIGSIVRSANAFGAAAVHIVGAKRWNRRGAMVTDRYQHVDHFPTTEGFVQWAKSAGLHIIGIDNVDCSQPLEVNKMPEKAVLVFGSEDNGLSAEMLAHCEAVYAITQYGSTRSINVGAAAAVAMWAWIISQK